MGDIDALSDLLAAGSGVVVLTGAGVSTDSGIPDYRGPNAVARTPMTFQEFVSGASAQQRYWARSYLGWRTMSRALPNDGHRALAELERTGVISTLITQNVDGLHRDAGSVRVVELHGRVDEVVCLGCRVVTDRTALQQRLDEVNPSFAVDASPRVLPDGDVDLEATGDFVVVACDTCGGVLKPHVVFFGENVERVTVDRCFAAVDGARALVVFGSSLTVHSGLRFVKRAHKRGIPIAIVNRGVTRADDLASIRVHDGCSETLVDLAGVLAT
jgi:NAD-dependent SIR2 family protein deacetylase